MNKLIKLKTLLTLFFWIGLCMATGYIGTFFTNSSMTGWYQNLSKPTFTPPGWVFGVVWTLLYILMAVAAFIISMKNIKKPETKAALALFLFQLVLNGLWTPIFFGMHLILAALIEIIILDLAILLTLIMFYKISKIAAALLVPYFIWVTFAIVLNAAFWRLNT